MSTPHPQRPHEAPCACETCTAWARSVVSAPAVRKPPVVLAQVDRPYEMPLAAFAHELMAIACKATGLNEFEIRARALEMGSEIPEPPVERVSREIVKARGVPEEHLESVYDREPIECDSLGAVKTFMGGTKVFLVLSGAVGLRKTGSACWALTQSPGCMVVAEELIRVSTARDQESIVEWRRYRAAQLLVLDSLGDKFTDDKGWQTSVIDSLIDHRYSHRLRTIITTNNDWPRFKERYGERVADRLRGSGRWINIGGASVRKRAAPAQERPQARAASSGSNH